MFSTCNICHVHHLSQHLLISTNLQLLTHLSLQLVHKVLDQKKKPELIIDDGIRGVYLHFMLKDEIDVCTCDHAAMKSSRLLTFSSSVHFQISRLLTRQFHKEAVAALISD